MSINRPLRMIENLSTTKLLPKVLIGSE